MSDTFNDFVNFISDDPLMLGLCIAVIVLIVIFIIVLCSGGKKKAKKEENKEIENTTQLLAADLNDEPLKSTQEYTLNLKEEENREFEKTINVPDVETLRDDIVEKEAPISIDEAMNLKTSREEDEIKDTIQIPVVEETPAMKVEIPTESILPTIEPMDSEDFADAILEANEVELPTMATIEMPKVETPSEVASSTQPFSSVYVNSNDELPKMDTESFSKTEIIRHIPVMEETVAKEEPVTPIVEEPANSTIDDVDLPKLNSSDDTSVLKTLTGESFNIK